MSACVFEAALREPEKCEQLLKHARELRSVQAALQHEQLADASQREADQLKQQVAELRRENQSLTRHQVGLQQQLERRPGCKQRVVRFAQCHMGARGTSHTFGVF